MTRLNGLCRAMQRCLARSINEIHPLPLSATRRSEQRLVAKAADVRLALLLCALLVPVKALVALLHSLQLRSREARARSFRQRRQSRAAIEPIHVGQRAKPFLSFAEKGTCNHFGRFW